MEERKGLRQTSSDFVTAVNSGEIEVVLRPNGQLEAVHHEHEAAGDSGVPEVPPSEPVEREAVEDAAKIAANRAEIARLKTRRIGAVNDLHDALGPWRWVLPIVFLAAAVAVGVVRAVLPITINGLAISDVVTVVLAIPMLILSSQLSRKARSPEAQKVRNALQAQRPKLSMRLVIDGVRGAFDRVNVDDRELEEALEPLYQHGCKMDNGYYPARR